MHIFYVIGNCCSTVKFVDGSMSEFYYPNLMGSYGQVSQLNGKPVYRQINGNYYLYWLSIGAWNVRKGLITIWAQNLKNKQKYV